MSDLASALNVAAPIYNLGLVAVVVYLFVRLFREPAKNHKLFMKPWYFVAGIIGIFILEEIITVLRSTGSINIPVHINGFFEMIIVSLIIYLLLIQKEHAKKFGC